MPAPLPGHRLRAGDGAYHQARLTGPTPQPRWQDPRPGRGPKGDRRYATPHRHLSAALAETGIRPSVGTVGDSYDNALAETVNGLYKAELIHAHGPWTSVGEVELATLRWVHWWNTKRLHEVLDYAIPQEVETEYYLTEPINTRP